MPAFDMGTDHEPTRLTLRFRGSLDAETAGPALDQVRELCRSHEGQPVAVDLSELSFLDSSGLQVLLVLWREMREKQRELQVLNPRQQPLHVLRSLGLLKVLGMEG